LNYTRERRSQRITLHRALRLTILRARDYGTHR